jgi:hypothetical protein
MKQLFTIVIISLIAISSVFAQPYVKGSKVINAGLGFGMAGIYGDSGMPPISIGFQYGLEDKISIGGIVGFSTSTYGWTNYEWSYTYISIGARGEYHFMENSDKLDAYAGLTLGYNVVSVSEPDGYQSYWGYESESSYLLAGVHVGARYALSEKIGIFGELGYGIGYLTVGVDFHL